MLKDTREKKEKSHPLGTRGSGEKRTEWKRWGQQSLREQFGLKVVCARFAGSRTLVVSDLGR